MGAVESRVSLLCWPSTAARYVLTEDRGVASNDVQHAIHLARCSRDGPLHSRRKNSNLWYSDWHSRLRRKSVSSLLCFKFGGRWKWRNETGTVIGRRDRVSFMRLNLGFSIAETRPIMAVNAAIYLQFSYMQLIKFILYICNPVPQQCEREFQGHIFVTIFSG